MFNLMTVYEGNSRGRVRFGLVGLACTFVTDPPLRLLRRFFACSCATILLASNADA